MSILSTSILSSFLRALRAAGGRIADAPLPVMRNAESGMRNAKWRWAAIAVSLAFGVVFSAYSIWLQRAFRASCDTAIHAQLLWNLSNGRFFETSFFPYSFAGNHFWPALYAVVPFFRAFGVSGMLALQAFLVGFGAWVAYRLCENETRSPRWAFLVACAYLCCPTISSGVLFDFHFELFSVPFSLLTLLWLQEGKWSFVFPLLLSLGFYEVNGLVWPVAGLLAMISRDGHRRCMGVTLFLLATAYFVIVAGFVMPHFRGIPDPHVWVRYSHLGKTPAEAVANIIRHPFASLASSVGGKDLASLRLFLAFGMLPVFGLWKLLPAIPLWLMLVFSNWDWTSDIRYGYFAPVVPFLVSASCLAVARIRKCAALVRRECLFAALSALCMCWTVSFYQVSKPMRRHPFVLRSNLPELSVAVSLIPEGDSISADSHICPMLYRRRQLQSTPDTTWHGGRCRWMCVDLRESADKSPGWSKRIAGMVSPRGYGVVWFQNDVAVLKFGEGCEQMTRCFLARLSELAESGKLP